VTWEWKVLILKLLVRSSSNAFRHYECSLTVKTKMANFISVERDRCVFRFQETKSAARIQGKFHTQYHEDAPNRPYVYLLHVNFCETGCCVRHAKKGGRHSSTARTVEQLTRVSREVYANQTDLRVGTSYSPYNFATSVKKTIEFKAIQIIGAESHHRCRRTAM
jgi:3-deoxy-D-manno-octulosonic-acid transferase